MSDNEPKKNEPGKPPSPKPEVKPMGFPPPPPPKPKPEKRGFTPPPIPK